MYQLVEKAPSPPSYVAIATTLKTIGDDRGARYWALQGANRFPNDAELRKMLRTAFSPQQRGEGAAGG